MKSYRLSKGCTAHYTSLEELRAAYNIKPMRKQTRDKEKLVKQRETFCGKHLCQSCKKPMIWLEGTNQMVCNNPDCQGIKHEQIINAETGETKVWYSPSYDLLDDLGQEIAQNLFAEYD